MSVSATQIVGESGTLLNLEGQRLGERFEVLKRIACGSYSEIYLARNLSPKGDEPEMIVVKALSLSLRGELDPALERTLIENIELEALTLSRLRHKHIVHLFECGIGAAEKTGKEFYYLVLEHLPGGDLHAFCRARPLSFEQTLEYLRQICNALGVAHAHNILHRDIKPNNILLTSDRRTAKLLDFGTARLLDRYNELITQVGTEVYSAPEVFSQAHTVRMLAPAADIYSLAKTAYYLLSGESPIHQKQRQITSLPPHVAAMPWAKGALYVLRKATCEHPEQRYQSAADFYKDLCDVAELTHISPRELRNESPHNEIQWQKRKRSRVEVPIISKPPRDYSEIAKGRFRLLFKYTKKTAMFAAAGVSVVRIWLRLWLRLGGVALAEFGRWLWRAFCAMPRKFAVRILTVIVIALMLLIAPPYLINWWRSLILQEPSQQTNGNLLTANEATTNTDLNIRAGPSSREQKIGVAEGLSRVRILSCNSTDTWCEIEVLRHGRAKKDQDSADRGWVNKRYLALH